MRHCESAGDFGSQERRGVLQSLYAAGRAHPCRRRDRARAGQKARRAPDAYGPTCVTTRHSVSSTRRLAYFYSRDRTGEHPERHLAGYAELMQRTPMPASIVSTTAPQAGADRRSRMLSACAAQVRRSGAPQQGSDRRRGGELQDSTGTFRISGSAGGPRSPNSKWLVSSRVPPGARCSRRAAPNHQGRIQELKQLDAIQDQLTPAVPFGLKLLARRTK
jgi:hypothetical protein